MNQQVKYVHQMSFCSKVIVRKHRQDTHRSRPLYLATKVVGEIFKRNL